MITFEVSEIIRTKKAQYCRFVDTKQWDGLSRLILPDAKFIFFGVDGGILHEFDSLQTWIELTAATLDGAHTSHRVSNSELTLLSKGQVAAIWAMEDYLLLRAKDGNPAQTMRGYGHYHEIWKQWDSDWFLAKLELTRTILEFKAAARSN
ncbi:nuclear transport factor 2 family protein [Bradyrhizobium sp. MOS001]|uniref:nuclear transport factor 2 family protein n=1 Tax=Bradyrhizobium sp. MOS001 TaxID=2133948 RepID=UPI001074BB17|nr:nuclear transport factor 2 family protein [Bradyrhizobium sp. MOS001]TFW56699.1 nuclear transport factor 2 family protein [Bradyrhizobium sp. MOS001]